MTFEELNSLEVWQQMPTITLDQMSSIKLMNRVDTKFVLSEERCLELLQRAVGRYWVQVIGDVRACRYETMYYDTPEWEMYRIHANQKLTRQKIRTRTYIETLVSFAEVKNKTNKGRTRKKRITVGNDHFYDIFHSATSREFIEGLSAYPTSELSPSLITRFERITLVNFERTERLTIDFNVRFINMRDEKFGEWESGESIENRGSSQERGIERLVIVELKQDGLCHSPMKDILLELRVKPMKVSKYLLGMVLTNPKVKGNRYRRKIRFIKKRINRQWSNPIWSSSAERSGCTTEKKS